MADITVGMNIRKFREARGLLQKDLGDRIGKNKNTVSNWERGLRDPGADNLKKIAAAVEISPSELIGHNDNVAQDNSFEVIVTDDSMKPDFMPGDRIRAVKSTDLHDGDIVVADLQEPFCFAPVIRSWLHIGNMTVLVPYNRQYPYTVESRFSVRGKVIELIRKI